MKKSSGMVERRYFGDEPDLSPFLKALHDVRQQATRVRGSGDGKPGVLPKQAAQDWVSEMADVATDLKQRFDWAMDLCLEAHEVLPDGRSFERSYRDEREIGIWTC